MEHTVVITSAGITPGDRMPRRATPDLPPERRRALEAELRVLGALESRAALDKYVYVSRAYDAGMSVRDIASVFDTSSSTATRWKGLGEQERKRRRRDDPDRPGERGEVA